jgi:hypothetical protein
MQFITTFSKLKQSANNGTGTIALTAWVSFFFLRLCCCACFGYKCKCSTQSFQSGVEGVGWGRSDVIQKTQLKSLLPNFQVPNTKASIKEYMDPVILWSATNLWKHVCYIKFGVTFFSVFVAAVVTHFSDALKNWMHSKWVQALQCQHGLWNKNWTRHRRYEVEFMSGGVTLARR